MTVVYYAVEGETDIPVAERLIRLVGLYPRATRVAGGKSQLDARIPALNRSGGALTPAGSPHSRAERGMSNGRHCAHPVSNALLQGSAVWSRMESGNLAVFETRCHSSGMLWAW